MQAALHAVGADNISAVKGTIAPSLEEQVGTLAFPTLIAAPDLYALKMVRESGIRCGRVPNMVKNRAGSEDTV